jgi:hypothetical protein
MQSMPQLSTQRTAELLAILEERFEKNKQRHKTIKWSDVLARLQSQPSKLWSLNEMEETGGEPDVIGVDTKTKAFIFVDCSVESPKGRRSICFDIAALESRKEHKPRHSAEGMAAEMGVSILTEEEYRHLQTLGTFDSKTSSWIATPDAIRKLGGALFCDYRYRTVFTYHNGAESYYAARGFRASLKI